MKAVVAAFNQEKALVGAFSVITNLRMEHYEALCFTPVFAGGSGGSVNCNTAQHRGFVQQQDLNCHEIGNMSR